MGDREVERGEEEQVPDQGGGRGENGEAEGTEGKRRGMHMQCMLALNKAFTTCVLITND